jgi:hypothetical protein
MNRRVPRRAIALSCLRPPDSTPCRGPVALAQGRPHAEDSSPEQFAPSQLLALVLPLLALASVPVTLQSNTLPTDLRSCPYAGLREALAATRSRQKRERYRLVAPTASSRLLRALQLPGASVAPLLHQRLFSW